MGNFLGDLIEVVARICRADSEIRDRSLLGESEMERKAQRSVAWLCGCIIVLLIIGGILSWWFTR